MALFFYVLGFIAIGFGALAVVSVTHFEAGLLLIGAGIACLPVGRGLDDLRAIRFGVEAIQRLLTPPPPTVEAHPIPKPPEEPPPAADDPPHPGSAYTRAVTGIRPPQSWDS